MRLSREGLLVLGIGTADLVTTLWLINAHGAVEGNPLMRFFLIQGIPVFVIAKISLCAAPVTVLEWARQHRPRFVQAALRCAIAIYLFAYLMGVFGLNLNPSLTAYADSAPISAPPPIPRTLLLPSGPVGQSTPLPSTHPE